MRYPSWDSHQRIYGERTVLSRFGSETRGRSRRLTLNYRTSRQNLAFAIGVIEGGLVLDLEGRGGYRRQLPLDVHRTGTDDPRLRHRGGETRFLALTVRGWLGNGVSAAAIAVLSHRTTEQDAARLALQDAGVAVDLLAKDGAGNAAAVKLASMHRAKGTEFARVVVVGAASAAQACLRPAGGPVRRTGRCPARAAEAPALTEAQGSKVGCSTGR